MKSFIKKLLVDWSMPLTLFFVVVALTGAYFSRKIELKLSLTDLLPQDHPGVVKFNKLTEIVGGVGYVEIVLHAEDKEGHFKIAPTLVDNLKKNPLVRSAFFAREEHFFLTHVLYYADRAKLEEFEKNIASGIVKAKRKVFDIGLWDEDTEKKEVPAVDPEFKKFAEKAADVSPYLVSKDGKDLVVMVKPSFDSLDMKKSTALVELVKETLKTTLPPDVTAKLSGRYYSKVIDSKIMEEDIGLLGILSNVVMALILLFYFRSIRAVISIFIPVVLGLGITALATYLVIGHINIVTGFLVGIISGVGSDYGIHLLWRIRLERLEPSSDDPDPLWRTLQTSGWANFVTLISAGVCFFLMCLSSFKAFSEFGFVCGVGLSAILIAKMGSFHWTSELLGLEKVMAREKYPFSNRTLYALASPASFWSGIAVTAFLVLASSRVGFEFDFDKMMQHSKEVADTEHLVDLIYDRSTTPSAFAAQTKEEALGIEKLLKEKYMPHTVSNIVSGATMVPDQQEEKWVIVQRIKTLIEKLKDSHISAAMGVPAAPVRTWVNAKPFVYEDLPSYVQEALRGTSKAGYLIYVYPQEHLNSGPAVARFANMIRDVETQFPNIVSGSDAGIFSDILDLIKRDGILLMAGIIIGVAIFIWINLRSLSETLLCYVPFLVSLPVGVGLMAIFQVKFNILNVAILPALIAVGIEIPIQLMQRAREIRSGFKAVRDIAVSLQLSLATTAIGFGALIFTRAGVLKSLGWISLMACAAIWWVGIFLQPAILERFYRRYPNKA